MRPAHAGLGFTMQCVYMYFFRSDAHVSAPPLGNYGGCRRADVKAIGGSGLSP